MIIKECAIGIHRPMKILHTSDWHLGRSLYGKKRYPEFTAFLEWLVQTIETEKIDILLIAGDVFDTSTPSNLAQKLYYQCLSKIAVSHCRHIVIIAGNHDSPSFLCAPQTLLNTLNVYVVGAISDDPADEVIVLNNQQLDAEAIICAIPYLRDKDIRRIESGESIDDKNHKLIEGVRKHYHTVCAIAEQKQQALNTQNKNNTIPIIAMGHLFTAGGQTTQGDGVRELYVGSLAHISGAIFPDAIDYLALGHLHIAQRVGGMDHIRYSGSPIAMGYGEAKQIKKVLIVSFNQKTPQVQALDVPCFQALERISGSLETIQSRIEQLKDAHSNVWLEIEYTGTQLITNLHELLEESLEKSAIEIRCIKNKRTSERILHRIHQHETLDDLNEYKVFERCLDGSNRVSEISSEERLEIIESYHDIINTLHEEDSNAE